MKNPILIISGNIPLHPASIPINSHFLHLYHPYYIMHKSPQKFLDINSHLNIRILIKRNANLSKFKYL